MPLLPRRDGDPVPDVPPYRRMMQLLMRKRSESFVFFEQKLDMSKAQSWLAEKNAGRAPEERLNFFHLITHAIVETIGERPRLNRFSMGGRLYQRRGIFV